MSLAHDIVTKEPADASTYLNRDVERVSETGAADPLQYSGTYHGTIHSHLDSIDCHVMVDGKGYHGVSAAEVEAADGCARGSIHALRDGVFTRGILFDATLLPGKFTTDGWLEPGTAIRKADLEALEKIQRVRVEPGDVILLHTGRWIRRAAVGPWSPNDDGVAGYHADVAYCMKERGVSFIGHDMWNDVFPHECSDDVRLPLHRLALVALGVGIFDNLDFTAVAETARELGRYEFLFTAAPLRIEKGIRLAAKPDCHVLATVPDALWTVAETGNGFLRWSTRPGKGLQRVLGDQAVIELDTEARTIWYRQRTILKPFGRLNQVAAPGHFAPLVLEDLKVWHSGTELRGGERGHRSTGVMG